MSKPARRWIVALAAVLAAAMAWLSSPVWLAGLGTWLDLGQKPTGADYVLVLGGGLAVRPFAGAAIYRAGLARKVLISDAKDDRDGRFLPTEVELSRRILLRRGVPASDILVLGPENGSTYDEARRLAEFLRTHPAQRVLIVTHDFHTRRADWIFRQCLAGSPVEIVVTGVPVEQFTLDRWWHCETGFVTVLGENLKLLGYLASYGRLRSWLAVAAALALVLALLLRRRRRSARPPTSPNDEAERGPA